jgi:hypothetical protein
MLGDAVTAAGVGPETAGFFPADRAEHPVRLVQIISMAARTVLFMMYSFSL